jgi:hypothetical protein
MSYDPGGRSANPALATRVTAIKAAARKRRYRVGFQAACS